MVRKSTVHRNPIGSTSEALQRQRSRQSLRRHIMDSQTDGMTMNTETLLEFNPKLADVSHTTRVAYAKFMTTKLKKEITFEDEKISIENEKERARGVKALNKFKINAGILKKNSDDAKTNNAEPKMEQEAASSEPPAVAETSKDFRARTPIEEDPYEDVQTPDRPSTPENILDEPVPKISSSPLPVASPSPSPGSSDARKPDSPIVKSRSLSIISEQSVKSSSEPSTIKAPELAKTDEEDDEGEDEPEKPATASITLNVPKIENRPVSPTFNTGDKGKSKITGKTLTGWI